MNHSIDINLILTNTHHQMVPCGFNVASSRMGPHPSPVQTMGQKLRSSGGAINVMKLFK